MELSEKEKGVIEDLQTQEKECIQKYVRYAEAAKDPVLKDLFNTLQKNEQEHYKSLEKVLDGEVPSCNCNDDQGRNYNPTATYGESIQANDKLYDDKQHDSFLATDCIGTEKLISSDYNADVFAFGDTDVRKLLADIQVEEQNHAEMLYKYKQVNGMA